MKDPKTEEQNMNPEEVKVETEDGEVAVDAPALLEQLEALKKELETKQKDALYARAEFENAKKRMQRDQEQAIRFANERMLRELIPATDLLDRALQAATTLKKKGDGELTNFISGIEMTQREMTQAFQRIGVEFVGSIGESFDPEKHEAISQVEGEAEQDGKVLEVLQKGCLLNGRLLSPARVVVGKLKND